jgi:hypothetical protein
MYIYLTDGKTNPNNSEGHSEIFLKGRKDIKFKINIVKKNNKQN